MLLFGCTGSSDLGQPARYRARIDSTTRYLPRTDEVTIRASARVGSKAGGVTLLAWRVSVARLNPLPVEGLVMNGWGG
jgi:hypothetical protein